MLSRSGLDQVSTLTIYRWSFLFTACGLSVRGCTMIDMRYMYTHTYIHYITLYYITLHTYITANKQTHRHTHVHKQHGKVFLTELLCLAFLHERFLSATHSDCLGRPLLSLSDSILFPTPLNPVQHLFVFTILLLLPIHGICKSISILLKAHNTWRRVQWFQSSQLHL